MGPTSAEIQALERAAVAGVQGHRASEVELVQGHGTVEYVLWEAEPRLSTWECYGLHCLCGLLPLPCSLRKGLLLPGCFLGSHDAERVREEREEAHVLGLGVKFSRGIFFRKKER